MGRRAACYLVTREHRHSLRTRVPLDLVLRLRCAQMVRALGTSDLRVARAIALRVGLHLDRLWLIMRTHDALTPVELRRLANAWLRKEVDREWALLESGEFAGKLIPVEAEPDEAVRAHAQLFRKRCSAALLAAAV